MTWGLESVLPTATPIIERVSQVSFSPTIGNSAPINLLLLPPNALEKYPMTYPFGDFFRRLMTTMMILQLFGSLAVAVEKPNVLFIAIDDLNDWVPTR